MSSFRSHRSHRSRRCLHCGEATPHFHCRLCSVCHRHKKLCMHCMIRKRSPFLPLSCSVCHESSRTSHRTIITPRRTVVTPRRTVVTTRITMEFPLIESVELTAPTCKTVGTATQEFIRSLKTFRTVETATSGGVVVTHKRVATTTHRTIATATIRRTVRTVGTGTSVIHRTVGTGTSVIHRTVGTGTSVIHRTVAKEDTPLHSKCCICLELPPDILLMPCRHFKCCERCSLRIERCPICRTEIDLRIKAFI